MMTALVSPLLYVPLFEVMGRYGGRLTYNQERDISISAMAFVSVLSLVFMYSCFTKFVGRKLMHPMWASPRLVTAMEIHPIYGWLLPVTSVLRGYIGFAFVRWVLNAATIYLLVIGHTVLRPMYLEACCYGLDALTGDESGGSCTSQSPRNGMGYEVCHPDGYSSEHQIYITSAVCCITVSCTLQLINIMTVDWDIINRIGSIQKLIKGGEFRVVVDGVVQEDKTVNLRLIMQLMGLTPRLEKLCFPGFNPEMAEQDFPWSPFRSIHEHVHWAHPGFVRLL